MTDKTPNASTQKILANNDSRVRAQSIHMQRYAILKSKQFVDGDTKNV